MSAPSGLRGSRSSPRVRGSTRGSIRGASRGRVLQPQSRRGATSSAAGGNSSQSHLRPAELEKNQRSTAGKSTGAKTAGLSSAILSHAGSISKLRDQPWRNAAEQDSATYKQRMSDLYQSLKEKRERERKQAIKDGYLANPDKPTSLANAITPVGTCQDMCPEFERVERTVQLMVDANEKIPSMSNPEIKVPCEELMVKRFRRSAAGYDEQLPSDIRPPSVLQKTLNHLFDSVIGGPETLANTHKFIWDRTRGIRNDFSIQQVTKIEDLKIAIDCFERIARFHILSLHQLSHPHRDNGEFDHHQEREQLNNTLLSLTYYYDDSRHKFPSPNEAEFRAYCVIFEIQDQRPDLEDRAQNWPSAILKDARVKTALRLYAAAGSISDEQGPLRPRTSFSIAQANTRGFFELVQSNSVSYMMACVAEIYFNFVRSTALESIWKAYKGKRPGAAKVEDWLLEDITHALGFDDHEQARTFCEEHEFVALERDDGEEFLNLGSVHGPSLKDNNPRRKQVFSEYLVENKRLGRTLPAVINGLSFAEAQAQGLVDDSHDEKELVSHNDSLFVSGESDGEKIQQKSRSASPTSKAATYATHLNNSNGAINPFSSTFDSNRSSSESNPLKPITSHQHQSIPAFASTSAASAQTSNPFASKEPSKFDFLTASRQESEASSLAPNPFKSKEIPKFNFFPVSNAGKIEDSKSADAQLTNGEQKSVKSESFGVPSVVSTGIPSTSASIFSGSQRALATQPSSIFTSSPSPTKPSTPDSFQPSTSNSDQDQNKAEAGAQSNSTTTKSGLQETEVRNSSSNTSGLFQRVSSEVSEQSGPLVFQPSTTSQSGILSNFSTSKSPAPTSLNSENLDKSSAPHVLTTTSITSPASSLPSNSPTSSSAPKFNFQIPDLPSNSLTSSNTPQFNFQTPNKSVSSKLPQIKGGQKPFDKSPTPPPSFLSASPADKSNSAESHESVSVPAVSVINVNSSSGSFLPEFVASTPPPPDHKPAALEKVTNGLVFDDGGLLQQYIEISVAPIVKSAIAQFEDEKSWKLAGEYRSILLAKKYLRKWKILAWNLGVMRRGRKRRENFAKSILSFGKISQQREPKVSRSSVLLGHSSQQASQESGSRESNTMLPPKIPTQKRQSLPVDLGVESSGAAQTPRNMKRKLDDSECVDQGRTNRSHVSGHKRSSTVGSSVNANSIPSVALDQLLPPQHRKSNAPSKLAHFSPLSKNTINQTRSMAPSTHSDTTQTDYFRLKALGINPDTPFAPLTKRRAVGSKKSSALPHDPIAPPQANSSKSNTLSSVYPDKPSTPNNSASNDDDEFFASIRAIRSTLADSTSWFQSERESIERSLTPSGIDTPPTSAKKETAAERRLREIKGRGQTPSRSEMRMRAMGDRSLLPADFWDGDRKERNPLSGEKGAKRKHGTQNETERHAVLKKLSPHNSVAGPMKASDQRPHPGLVNGFGQHSKVQSAQANHGGENINDVIELSD